MIYNTVINMKRIYIYPIAMLVLVFIGVTLSALGNSWGALFIGISFGSMTSRIIKLENEIKKLKNRG